ncbi:hypothetical protein CABS03_15391 [Colletotrichum abscissum]
MRDRGCRPRARKGEGLYFTARSHAKAHALSCIRDALLLSAAQGPVPPAAYCHQSRSSLATATLHRWHGSQDLTAVRSCGPDRLSVDLPTRETAPRGLRRPRRPSSQPRCNVPYTIEQIDFIAYFRDDLRLPWKTVEEQFAVVFPRDVNRGHRRRAPGLQGIYYRQNNRSSKQDSDGFLMLDSTDGSFASKRRCWGRGGKTTGSNGLLATHPERAVNYAWVSVEHKTQCSIGYHAADRQCILPKMWTRRCPLWSSHIKSRHRRALSAWRCSSPGTVPEGLLEAHCFCANRHQVGSIHPINGPRTRDPDTMRRRRCAQAIADSANTGPYCREDATVRLFDEINAPPCACAGATAKVDHIRTPF